MSLLGAALAALLVAFIGLGLATALPWAFTLWAFTASGPSRLRGAGVRASATGTLLGPGTTAASPRTWT